jgi:hypothetical protein
MQVQMYEPTVLIADSGHPIQRLSGKQITEVLSSLREFKLPPEKGPYADNKDGSLAQIAWDMKKALRARVKGLSDSLRIEEEVKWIIDVLIPRMMIFEDGPKIVAIKDMWSHPMLRTVTNFHDLRSRESEEIMDAGSLVASKRAEIFNNEYLLINYEEERVAVAAAILRENEREAYSVSFIRPDLSMREGVAIFPNEETMLTFSFFDTHPQTAAMLLYSDHAMMSVLALQSSENIKRKTTTDVMNMVGEGKTEINAFVDSKMKLMRERIKIASQYWGDNDNIDSHFEELDRMEDREHLSAPEPEPDVVRVVVPGPENTPKDMIRSNNITTIIDGIESRIMDANGVARKVKGLFRTKFTEGMHPDQVVREVKDVLDKLKEAFEEFGYDSLYLLKACKYIGNVINDQLPGRGLGVEYLAELNDYFMPVLIKLREAESKE